MLCSEGLRQFTGIIQCHKNTLQNYSVSTSAIHQSGSHG